MSKYGICSQFTPFLSVQEVNLHHLATLSSILLSSKRNLLAAPLSQGCSKNLAYFPASKEEDSDAFGDAFEEVSEESSEDAFDEAEDREVGEEEEETTFGCESSR